MGGGVGADSTFQLPSASQLSRILVRAYTWTLEVMGHNGRRRRAKSQRFPKNGVPQNRAALTGAPNTVFATLVPTTTPPAIPQHTPTRNAAAEYSRRTLLAQRFLFVSTVIGLISSLITIGSGVPQTGEFVGRTIAAIREQPSGNSDQYDLPDNPGYGYCGDNCGGVCSDSCGSPTSTVTPSPARKSPNSNDSIIFD